MKQKTFDILFYIILSIVIIVVSVFATMFVLDFAKFIFR